jgi:hypothetical protein
VESTHGKKKKKLEEDEPIAGGVGTEPTGARNLHLTSSNRLSCFLLVSFDDPMRRGSERACACCQIEYWGLTVLFMYRIVITNYGVFEKTICVSFFFFFFNIHKEPTTCLCLSFSLDYHD